MLINKQAAIFLLFSLSYFNHSVYANELGQKIAMQGNAQGATACIACHGADGGGQVQAGFPRLAGLAEQYLINQLESFDKGTRQSPVMGPIAKAMSKQEIAAVTNYFAKLPTPKGKMSTSTDKTLMLQGKQLATKGNWDNNVPACYACHGPQARGVGQYFPALAGQPAGYITQQIQAWRSGTRTNDPNQLMQGIAKRLSEAEISAVSMYLASLSATAK